MKCAMARHSNQKLKLLTLQALLLECSDESDNRSWSRIR